MNRIELLENNRFHFTTWSEMALLSLKDEDAQKLVELLEKAADDLLKKPLKQGTSNNFEIHYKHLRLFFKVEKNLIDVIHLVHINAFPLNGNKIYEAV
jgi:mRNA-degrading endonuclease RelE of RelBE toxin-antitoxin system